MPTDYSRNKSLYSPAHDYSKNPPAKGRKRSRKPVSSTPVFGEPPQVTAGFLPPHMSDEKRRELRARQMVADLAPGRVPQRVNDHDTNFDPDLDVSDPRGELFTQESGPVNTIFPGIMGPQFSHTDVRGLNKREIHPPLPDFQTPSRANASKLEVIAAVSADDETILAVDNQLTQVHTQLKSLRQSVQRMQQSVSRQDDDAGRDDSSTDHATNMHKMLTTIIEPWFDALESEFTGLLEGTSQHDELEK